jgi:hypothetical protein
MKAEGRIALDTFPEDWKYYTLTFPVARYKHLSLDAISDEMLSCDRTFYSMPRILRRVCGNMWGRRQPLISLVGNFSFRKNSQLSCEAYAAFKRYLGNRHDCVNEVMKENGDGPFAADFREGRRLVDPEDSIRVHW